MKYLINASSIWMLVLFTSLSLSSEVNVEENTGNLLLSLDCEGQLYVPLLEAQIDFSERLLGALWDIDDLRSHFSPCDFQEKECYSKFIFQVGQEEIFTIERHLQACPNRKRPAASFMCVGDACSKILTPCESSSDCGTGLHCPQKRTYRSEYHSEITSELFSKILFPQSRPTSKWRFCEVVPFNHSVVRVDGHYESISGHFKNRSRLFVDTTIGASHTSNITVLGAYCNGRTDLFGRGHFVGVLKRAIHTIQELPLGFLKNVLDFVFNLFRFWTVNGLAGIPVEDYTNITRFLGLEVNLEDTTKWVVYSRLLNETLIIETNSCGATDNILIDVKVTPGIYKLFSINSCTYHIECTSGMCIIPPKETVRDKEGDLFLRTIFGFEQRHQGFCLPWIQLNYTFWFSNQEYINELIQMANAVHMFDYILTTPNKQMPKEFDNKFDKNASDLSGIFNAILWFIGLLSVVRFCCREYNNQNMARTQ